MDSDAGPPAAPDAADAAVVWVAVSEPEVAGDVARALADAGRPPAAVVHDVAGVQRLLAQRAPPALLVMGLRFADGDGFQLMRLLARRARAPAVFILSRQQRAVIKTASSLAESCGLPLAGAAELPAQADAIVRSVLAYRPDVQRPAPPVRPELSRDELLSLFDRDVLQPWMQPKWRLATGEIVGFEALMRAHDAEGRLVMPDRLVAALGRHQLLDEATLHMARRTVDFVASCLAEGMAISASINVSMQSLSNFSFCQELAAAVDQAGVDPSWITIEITETDAMADLASVIENTGRIRMLGFNLAIDDFGTAYSSLFQLSRIPFSELKIERAFVTGIAADRGKQGIVKACAMLGASLGLHVVAEGVETLEELQWIRDAGCTEVQGYLVSRPMPAGRALDWLRGLPDQRFELPVSG
ncbi:EAL domain-containing response regulator [Aquincola sp. MAHUQ-54]|uniref:EAL domain-containing response regulator n=1 Tax=Aquincola agrisoli TaxID=3119538 RepID=A0AAW9Q8B8_9BURK